MIPCVQDGWVRVVDMIHGCVPQWRSDSQADRNYVSEGDFVTYLRRRPDAYDGRVNTLTVDDSTVGAARACLIAREEGHQVTIFINPAQIERQRSYWFSTLDAALDATKVRHLSFGGEDYDLERAEGVRALRLAIKARLMPLAESGTDELLSDLMRRLLVPSVEVQAHGRTITRADLHQLKSAGVRIGNHGWDHRDIGAMATPAVAQDLQAAGSWLEQELGAKPADYAVPYGLQRLPSEAWAQVSGAIFLADFRVPCGDCGDRHENRRDITKNIRQAALGGVSRQSPGKEWLEN